MSPTGTPNFEFKQLSFYTLNRAEENSAKDLFLKIKLDFFIISKVHLGPFG